MPPAHSLEVGDQQSDHPLINQYCIVGGFPSNTASSRYNGRTCYVVRREEEQEQRQKEDKKRESSSANQQVSSQQQQKRLAVLFESDMGAEGGGNGKYVLISAENLTPKFGVEVKPSFIEGIGKGLFATRAFKQGEIIFSEKPILTVKDRSLLTLQKNLEALSDPEIDILEGFTAGEELDAAKAKAAGPMALWYRILRANAHGWKGVLCLYPLLCRVNHACLCSARSNVWWTSVSPSSSSSSSSSSTASAAIAPQHVRVLTASRDISAGEELFADYCWTIRDPKERAEKLSVYGIRGCEDCALCSPPSWLSPLSSSSHPAAPPPVKKGKGGNKATEVVGAREKGSTTEVGGGGGGDMSHYLAEFTAALTAIGDPQRIVTMMMMLSMQQQQQEEKKNPKKGAVGEEGGGSGGAMTQLLLAATNKSHAHVVEMIEGYKKAWLVESEKRKNGAKTAEAFHFSSLIYTNMLLEALEAKTRALSTMVVMQLRSIASSTSSSSSSSSSSPNSVSSGPVRDTASVLRDVNHLISIMEKELHPLQLGYCLSLCGGNTKHPYYEGVVENLADDLSFFREEVAKKIG